MFSLKNIKIRSRLITLLVVLIIPMILIGILGIYGINSSNASIKRIFDDRLIPADQLSHINMLMLESMEQINLATKHDPRLEESQLHSNHAITKHTNTVREHVKELDEIWKKYTQAKLTEEEENLANEFEAAHIELENKGLLEAVKLLESGKYKETNIHAALVNPKLFNKAKEIAEKLLDLQIRVAKEEHEKAVSNYNMIFAITAGSLGIGILLAISLGILIIGSITRPLSQAVVRIKDIAEGEGDLTKRLAANTTDELGDLSNWIDRFIIKIHDIVVDIAETTDNVYSSAQNLAEASQGLSAGTEQMSQQSQNIAASTAQMNQNLQVIASSLEETSISVNEVAKQSGEASNISSEANNTASKANQLVSELGESAKEIGNAIDSIVSIANQTNLLALNASIEAAGAGDAGKGFAVVASEVKELARQAGEFSEDIRGKIVNVQKNTDLSIKSIQNIAQVISQVNSINGNIAAAVEEQSITSNEITNNVAQTTSASNEIAKNIEGISVAAREGAINAQKVNSLSGNLENLSSNLNKIVSQFKIQKK